MRAICSVCGHERNFTLLTGRKRLDLPRKNVCAALRRAASFLPDGSDNRILAQAASTLDCSPSYLRRWLRDKGLSVAVVVGG